MDQGPEVSITLTRYREPDLLVRDALMSLAAQVGVRAETLFLDQQNSPCLHNFVDRLSKESHVFRYEVIAARGLSYARNQAIKRASADIVLFLDADAVAQPHWAARLAAALSRSPVGVAGGKIVPRWHRPPPVVTRSRWVWEQYSLLDLGAGTFASRKVIGAGFGIHKVRLGEQACFDQTLGRRDGMLLAGEEMDLCRRAACMGLEIYYCGDAVVEHQILPERVCYRWILKRIFYTGFNRAVAGGALQPTHPLGFWDYVFLPLLLPFYLAGRVRARHARR